MSVPSSAEARRERALRKLLELGGASSLQAYLGLSTDAGSREVLAALERKRQRLEASLDDPARAREAEHFLEHYDTVRETLAPRSHGPATTPLPDYYAALKVRPGASFAAIERAWRRVVVEGRSEEPAVAQAWRVLGDPLNRARYDRHRRGVEAQRLERTRRPARPAAAPPDTPQSTARILGHDTRTVHLEPGAELLLSLDVQVDGHGPFEAIARSDHPAVQVVPSRHLSLDPGTHRLTVAVDPSKVEQRARTVTLRLVHPHQILGITYHLRLGGPSWRSRLLPLLYVLALVALVGLGVAIGSSTQLTTPSPEPLSVNDLSSIPAAQACLRPSAAPLPAWVDVHTNGLGRPTGFQFGGAASPEVRDCTRAALVDLSFPPTPDGLPAIHRFKATPAPGDP